MGEFSWEDVNSTRGLGDDIVTAFYGNSVSMSGKRYQFPRAFYIFIWPDRSESDDLLGRLIYLAHFLVHPPIGLSACRRLCRVLMEILLHLGEKLGSLNYICA